MPFRFYQFKMIFHFGYSRRIKMILCVFYEIKFGFGVHLLCVCQCIDFDFMERTGLIRNQLNEILDKILCFTAEMYPISLPGEPMCFKLLFQLISLHRCRIR